MADQPTTAVAVAEDRPRTRIVVADVVPIFDTARFEHYGRIAVVIAQTRMMPDSLCKEKIDGKDQWLDLDTIKARAFRIVALSDRWNCDPFQLMGACSFVHNQLMIEGKVIHGVVDAELGVVLDYEFGLWDAKREMTVLDSEGTVGEGDAMAVRVSATLPGETKLRYVDGSVGIWKTTGNNTPWKPGAFRRQLRYRGAREWTRAYKPSLLIGVVGDDEFDEYRDRRDVVQSAPIGLDPGFPREALPAPQEPAKAETGKRASGKRKAPEASQEPAGDGKSSGGGGAEYIDPDTGEVYGSIEERLAAEKAKREVVSGEVIEGESRVVQTAEQGNDTKGSATDASTGSQDQGGSGQQQQGEASNAGASDSGKPTDATTDDFPGDRSPAGDQAGSPDGDQAPHPFIEAIGKIGEAPHWDAIKQAARSAQKQPTWATDEAARRLVRARMWDRFCEIRDAGEPVVAVHTDMALMALWLDFAAESEEAIDGVWRSFFRNPAYVQAPKEDQKTITDKMVERKAALKGGG